MAKISRFQEIEAWKEARLLARQIFALTSNEKFRKDLALRDQIRRAAVSAMSNIAEGFGRESTKEFIRFLNIAKGSALEVQSILYVLLDNEFINEETFESSFDQTEKTVNLIGGFTRYLRSYQNAQNK